MSSNETDPQAPSRRK